MSNFLFILGVVVSVIAAGLLALSFIVVTLDAICGDAHDHKDS